MGNRLDAIMVSAWTILFFRWPTHCNWWRWDWLWRTRRNCGCQEGVCRRVNVNGNRRQPLIRIQLYLQHNEEHAYSQNRPFLWLPTGSGWKCGSPRIKPSAYNIPGASTSGLRLTRRGHFTVTFLNYSGRLAVKRILRSNQKSNSWSVFLFCCWLVSDLDKF